MVLEILDEGLPAITDGAVVEALMSVPRHLFVVPEARSRAYRLEPTPIGRGQVTSNPALVAQVTQLLQLSGREKVLEIGTGTGYHAAILGRLAAEVISLEIDPVLAARARDLVPRFALAPVRILVADGSRGLAAEAPYDAIVISAGVERVDPVLTDQLLVGGRLVAPVGPEGDQWLTLMIRRRDGLERRRIKKVRYRFLVEPPRSGK